MGKFESHGSPVDRRIAGGYDDRVKRLELARVRICQRCGRGRAELVANDGATLSVPLDASRTHELAQPDDAADVPWMSTVVLRLLAQSGGRVRDVVLDANGHGLRALVTLGRAGGTEIVACTAQEGVGLAIRATAPLYATSEALARATKPEASGRETIH